MCSVLMHTVFLQWTGTNQGVFVTISMDWRKTLEGHIGMMHEDHDVATWAGHEVGTLSVVHTWYFH